MRLQSAPTSTIRERTKRHNTYAQAQKPGAVSGVSSDAAPGLLRFLRQIHLMPVQPRCRAGARAIPHTSPVPTMRFKTGVGNLSQRVATFTMTRAGSLRFSEGQPCIPSRTSGEHGVSTPISRVLIFTFCSQKDVCLFTGEGYSNHCPKGTEDKTKQRLPRERHAMRRFSKCLN